MIKWMVKRKITLLAKDAVGNSRTRPLEMRRASPSSPTRSVSEVLRKSRGTLGSVGDDARRFPDEAPPTLPGHSDAFSVFVGGAPASSGLRNARDVAGECGNRIPLVDSC